MRLIAANIDDDDEIPTGGLVFEGHGTGWRAVSGRGIVPARIDPGRVVLEDGLEQEVSVFSSY